MEGNKSNAAKSLPHSQSLLSAPSNPVSITRAPSSVARIDQEKLGHDPGMVSMLRPTWEPSFHPTTRQCPSGTYRSVPGCLYTMGPVKAEIPETVPTVDWRSPPDLRPTPYPAACRT